VILFNLLWCAMVLMDVANIFWGSQLFNHYLGCYNWFDILSPTVFVTKTLTTRTMG
jgi:hypothetical protein